MKIRTRSQEKILSLLKVLNRPISAQDLYVELRNQKHNIGLATVYRGLEALKLEGVVRVRTLGNGESLYNLVQRDRHYLTCLNCGCSIPLAKCPVSQLEQELQQSYQFKVYYHTLEFFGLCDRCQKEQNQ
ncbi:MAG: transcriptional repressor [Cyanobacteria bacterium SBLK]|nr:transcriptional repressor [Cyanobacteria bacterium SBLK]